MEAYEDPEVQGDGVTRPRRVERRNGGLRFGDHARRLHPRSLPHGGPEAMTTSNPTANGGTGRNHLPACPGNLATCWQDDRPRAITNRSRVITNGAGPSGVPRRGIALVIGSARLLAARGSRSNPCSA